MSYERTAEHRRQASQRARCNKPWLYSTGPRTSEGKAVVSRNAYKGGIRKFERSISSALRAQQQYLAETPQNSCIEASLPTGD